MRYHPWILESKDDKLVYIFNFNNNKFRSYKNYEKG
jgi:hypothetical protein